MSFFKWHKLWKTGGTLVLRVGGPFLEPSMRCRDATEAVERLGWRVTLLGSSRVMTILRSNTSAGSREREAMSEAVWLRCARQD